jgi:hypothetical protein
MKGTLGPLPTGKLKCHHYFRNVSILLLVKPKTKKDI